jgi:hypothetical protein
VAVAKYVSIHQKEKSPSFVLDLFPNDANSLGWLCPYKFELTGVDL